MGSEAPSRQRYDGRHLCCSGLAVANVGSARGGGGRGFRPAHSGSAAETRMEGLSRKNGALMVMYGDCMVVLHDLALLKTRCIGDLQLHGFIGLNSIF